MQLRCHLRSAGRRGILRGCRWRSGEKFRGNPPKPRDRGTFPRFARVSRAAASPRTRPCRLALRVQVVFAKTLKEGANPMKYRKLGNSGVLVSSLSLGTMQFGQAMKM